MYILINLSIYRLYKYIYNISSHFINDIIIHQSNNINIVIIILSTLIMRSHINLFCILDQNSLLIINLLNS